MSDKAGAQQVLGEVAAHQCPEGSVPWSIIAAKEVDANPKRKIRNYLQILRALYHEPGLTDEELEQRTGIRPNSLRPRRGELAGNVRGDGPWTHPMIERTGGGTTASGRKCARWYLNALGRWVVEQTWNVKIGETE